MALTALGLLLAPMAVAESTPLRLPDAFAVESLETLRSPEQNTLFSPLNLLTAVTLARAGIPAVDADDTNTETVAEPNETPISEAEEAADCDCPPAQEQEDGSATPISGLTVANAVWLDEIATATPTTLEILETEWGISPTTLDLASEGRAAINGWVAEATDDRISSLLGTDPANVALILTSALVYKGVWAKPFDPENTEDGPFTLSNGEMIDLPMMRGTGTIPVWETEAGWFAALAFTDGLQMMLHLPPADPVISVVFPEEGFDFDDASPYQVVMPVFDLSNTLDLTESLAALGVEASLKEGLATFTTEPGMLGPVVQAVSMKVDEEGAEAAAATAISATRTLRVDEPEALRFDRPFDVYLYDPETGETVVAAHIADPRG